MIAACVMLVAALTTGASPPVTDASPPVTDASPPADAVPEAPTDARSEAARGEALFAEQRFAEASAAYARAYELERIPAFLFARARSEQEAGRCDVAIEIYRRFIRTQPPASDVDRANMEIGRCYGESRAAAPTISPRVEPAAVPPPVAAPVDEPRRRRSSPAWIRDPAGGAMLGAGFVVLATGLGLFLAGDATDDRAGRAATTDDFRRMIGRARTLEGVGIAGISLGSALLVGAITRYAVVARKSRRNREHRSASRAASTR